MCDKKEKVILSELILTAICHLQEKNGVTACEIAQYIARKRGCKISQIECMVKKILCKAKNHGILCEKKGLYRIEERFDDSAIAKNDQNDAIGNFEDSEEDDYDSNDEVESKLKETCACLKLSQDNLEDDEEEENQCANIKKKRKSS